MQTKVKSKLDEVGYEIVESIYSQSELDKLESAIPVDKEQKVFGQREFLKSNPLLIPMIFNAKLKSVLFAQLPQLQLIKSIYFNKPPKSNWNVPWHQDLTLNLSEKIADPAFSKWRNTSGRISVIPPIDILESIITIRMHLDDTSRANGALKVVPASHELGIFDMKKDISTFKAREHICEVQKGGILLMKPLTLHASQRSNNNLDRRVIHLELINPAKVRTLQFSEALVIER